MIKIGEKIPDVVVEALHNDEMKKLRISDYRGKWLVLIFYPGDFTFICPTELREAAESYEEFMKLGAEIMSVSVDSVFVHKAWHDSSPSIKKINFPMASDPTGRICREFGTYLEESGVSLRGTFIIDPDGAVKTIEIHDNGIGRSTEELLRKLAAAKFVKENKGEVCPASWKPGEKSIKPGLNLVGKL